VRLTHEEFLTLGPVEGPGHRLAFGILEIAEALEHVAGVDPSGAIIQRQPIETLIEREASAEGVVEIDEVFAPAGARDSGELDQGNFMEGRAENPKSEIRNR
jgi:hypothetical protein